MRVHCVFCGDVIDNERPGVYQYVKGWERLRKGGGTHAIRMPDREPRWACHACIDAMVKVGATQEQLF